MDTFLSSVAVILRKFQQVSSFLLKAQLLLSVPDDFRAVLLILPTLPLRLELRHHRHVVADTPGIAIFARLRLYLLFPRIKRTWTPIVT